MSNIIYKDRGDHSDQRGVRAAAAHVRDGLSGDVHGEEGYGIQTRECRFCCSKAPTAAKKGTSPPRAGPPHPAAVAGTSVRPHHLTILFLLLVHIFE
ncbi:hypothetical protein CEXT_741291 [Caerostris extrusa]|uniref:Uncharacterized protein n=1 Tax=Caerostris extrusa TaxID=172846 RepID=A0AAV4MSC3_CAEEX|nr:hypothetical protein CEXT_741291 [Caerostris extrusa]